MSREPSDPFDRIEGAAENLARRVIWEQGNRIGLLRVHVAVGILTGGQMLAFGSAATLEALFGPAIRIFLGVLGMTGGIILLIGLEKRPRSIVMEALGLTLLGLWDLTMTVGLAWARIHSTSFGLKWPWVPLPPPEAGFVTPYPATVYAGLGALITIHLWTLRKFKRAGVPPAMPTKERPDAPR